MAHLRQQAQRIDARGCDMLGKADVSRRFSLTSRLQSDTRKYYIFMVVPGMAGLAISRGVMGPRYLLFVPGLSEQTHGRVTDRRLVPAAVGQYDYLIAIVQYSDADGRQHAINWSGGIGQDVQVRYMRSRPGFAIVDGNWLDNATRVFSQLPCVDLPCLALIALGLALFINSRGERTRLPAAGN
jgi:hypothetical protein